MPYNFKSLLAYHPSLQLDFLDDIFRYGFRKHYKSTIGVDILLSEVNLNDEEMVKLCFWDIAMGERFNFFRSSFYRGASSIVIVFDYENPNSAYPFIPEVISELYSSVGPIPIILVGLNPDPDCTNAFIQQLIDENNIFYFEFENRMNFHEIILKFVANLCLKLITNASDAVSSEIRKKIEEFIALKQEGIDNFYDTLQDWGLKIIEDKVQILNKYGLFTINLISGRVLYESLLCQECRNIEKCRKNDKALKKSLCIVSDSMGWNNLYMTGDKLLILSKIFAIINEDLPQHVLIQMQEVTRCRHFYPQSHDEPVLLDEIEPESIRIMEYIDEVNVGFDALPRPENYGYQIPKNLSFTEIESRRRLIKTLLYQGRMDAETYCKMNAYLDRIGK